MNNLRYDISSTREYVAEQPAIFWKSAPPSLSAFDIELTERCNNDCIHCCISQPEQDPTIRSKELSTAAVKELLKQGVGQGALTVRFTGGEPLLRDDFIELYLFARRLGLRVMLFTNGRLITPELANLFKRVPPREAIEITVYGMSAGSYEAVSRQRGSFAEFYRGITLLTQNKIPFIVKGTMLPQTKREFTDFMTWAEKLPGMKDPPSFVLFLELRHRRDSEIKNRQIEKLRLSPEEGLAVLSTNSELYRRDLYRIFKHIAGRPIDKIFSCNAGNRICIDAYGQIQYCLALRHPATAIDSRLNTIEYALREFFPHLRELRSSNPEFLKRCAKCALRGLCEQCPAKSWIEHGILDQPVQYCCEIAHEQARYLGVLKEGEMGWEVADWRARLKALKME